MIGISLFGWEFWEIVMKRLCRLVWIDIILSLKSVKNTEGESCGRCISQTKDLF